MQVFQSYLQPIEFYRFTSLNKRIHDQTRATFGWKIFKGLIYWGQVINRGDPSQVKFVFNGNYQGNKNFDFTHQDNNDQQEFYPDDQTSMMNQSMAYTMIDGGYVSQEDIDKYQNNEKVKIALKKYMIQDFKPGVGSDKV